MVYRYTVVHVLERIFSDLSLRNANRKISQSYCINNKLLKILKCRIFTRSTLNIIFKIVEYGIGVLNKINFDLYIPNKIKISKI